jgi:hypothetical protein
MKKQQVATSEGHCKLAIPEIEWPLVQPPANVKTDQETANNNHNKSFEG